MRLSLAFVVLLLAGCGSSPASPASVVRAWSAALNADDNESAANLFARDAEIVQGGAVARLHTHAEAVGFNASLPCSGRILDLSRKGNEVTATFLLGDRMSSSCNGPGQKATAVFRIRGGKIVLWHQVDQPPGEGGPTV